METVYVNADKDKQEHGTLPGGFVNTKTEVGVLGKKDTMEVPFSVTNITQKTMEVFGGPDKPQDSIFVNSPSVRQTGSICMGISTSAACVPMAPTTTSMVFQAC